MEKIKLYLGFALLLLSALIPLSGFWVASLALPVAIKTVLIGALTVGGPEILALLAVALLGKSTFDLICVKFQAGFKELIPRGAVGKTRYLTGLALFSLSFFPSYVLAYMPNLLTAAWRIYLCVSADLVLIISLFILGGDFWDKLKALFVYEAKASFPSNDGA